MSPDTNLSSDHMKVECVLERCEKERVANTSTDPVLIPIAGETCDEQFSEVAGLDRPARRRLACDLLKLEQSLNDNHVAEIFGQRKTMAMASRMGLTAGMASDMPRRCWDLNDGTNTERLCKYVQNERPVLLV